MLETERLVPIGCAAVAAYALALLVGLGDPLFALIATLPLCLPLLLLMLARQPDTKLGAFAVLALLWGGGVLVMLRSFFAFGGPGHLAVLFLPLLSVALLLFVVVGGIVSGAVLLLWQVAASVARRRRPPAE
ncbi:MAG: hypothetical protein M3N07_02640 [Pseudomonadota bacterium]|nr:hypothetical protein [Pseudomonadota bacterium]